MPTVLTDQHEVFVEPALIGGGLWLSPDDLTEVTGFELKPQGLCKGDVCVPVPRNANFVDGAGRVDAAAFWRYIGNVAVHDAEADVWAFGAGADARKEAGATLAAPDFELPDLDGHLHRLSDYRGRKVLLATWASW